MAMAALRYRISDPYLIIDSFCSNAADMLYLSDRGRIEEKAKADIIGLDLEFFEQLPYFGTLDFIDLIIKNGVKISHR
jgi:imidazolonepropionase-like amidohydrolase